MPSIDDITNEIISQNIVTERGYRFEDEILVAFQGRAYGEDGMRALLLKVNTTIEAFPDDEPEPHITLTTEVQDVNLPSLTIHFRPHRFNYYPETLDGYLGVSDRSAAGLMLNGTFYRSLTTGTVEYVDSERTTEEGMRLNRDLEVIWGNTPTAFQRRMTSSVLSVFKTHFDLNSCEECGDLHSPGRSHFTCDQCGELHPVSMLEDVEIWAHTHQSGDSYQVGKFCYDLFVEDLDLSTCVYCDVLIRPENTYEIGDEPMCPTCYEEHGTYWCNQCEQNVPHDEWDYDEDMCRTCAQKSRLIHEWNYTPDFTFHPFPPSEGHPMFIGMELEMSWPSQQGRWFEWLRELPEELLYAKHDSSVVDGFEVVTHPMTPEWARKHFPFHLFEEAIEMGALKTHSSTGTHIHINREAFTTAHLWKFLQLHYRLPEFCGMVGGRGTEASYGRLIPQDRGSNDMAAQRREALEVAKTKGAINKFARYLAINLQNEYTIELRYMKGSILPAEIKKNIEWVQAVYRFTDRISMSDVRGKALDDAGYLLEWINTGDYPNLQAWIARSIPTPKPLAERSF